MTCLLHDAKARIRSQPEDRVPHAQFDEVLFADDTAILARSHRHSTQLLHQINVTVGVDRCLYVPHRTHQG